MDTLGSFGFPRIGIKENEVADKVASLTIKQNINTKVNYLNISISQAERSMTIKPEMKIRRNAKAKVKELGNC